WREAQSLQRGTQYTKADQNRWLLRLVQVVRRKSKRREPGHIEVGAGREENPLGRRLTMPKGNYRYQSDRDNSELVTLGDEQKRTIRTLIANLIIDDAQAAAGMVSRIHEMGDHQLT